MRGMKVKRQKVKSEHLRQKVVASSKQGNRNTNQKGVGKISYRMV